MTHNDMVNCVNEHLHKWYFGNNHFENALNLVNDYDEQIRTDERRKFAEILKSKPYFDEVHNMESIPISFIDEVLEEYEKGAEG